MQVRFDDSGADRKRLGKQAFLWAPLRVFGVCLATVVVAYYGFGHDSFMHTVLGYESEMQYETRVNPTYHSAYGERIDKDRAWKSPLRDLEEPLHPKRSFDVLRDPKSI